MEYYDPENETSISVLNLPVKIDKNELEKSINQQLSDVLYEDDNLRDDGLMIKATKADDIALEIDDKIVKYRVPVNLWVRKDLSITTVDAEGSITLHFETAYDVQPDWTFRTSTELKQYEWTTTPVLKLGIANLNVTAIANQFIKKAKGDLSSTIDEQIKDIIHLKEEINKAWLELHRPILVSEEHSSWLMMNPRSLSLTPLSSDDNLISSTIVITAAPRLVLGKKPETAKIHPLPDFSYENGETDDDFSLYVGTAIPFSEAERIAKENMAGEQFKFGRREVEIQDIELYGQGNKLVVKTSMTGSYNGDIYLIGQPDYNERRNNIQLKDLKFEFSTKKKLMQTASWLFRGKLRKRIQENLNFHLHENLEATREAIEKELENFELAPGMRIQGNLEEVNVSHVFISTDGISVKVGLSGKLNLDIKEIVAN